MIAIWIVIQMVPRLNLIRIDVNQNATILKKSLLIDNTYGLKLMYCISHNLQGSLYIKGKPHLSSARKLSSNSLHFYRYQTNICCQLSVGYSSSAASATIILCPFNIQNAPYSTIQSCLFISEGHKTPYPLTFFSNREDLFSYPYQLVIYYQAELSVSLCIFISSS